LLKAVEATNNIIIGDSITNAIGKTTPPNAAKLTSGCNNRATTALRIGSSADINSQLAARGLHLRKISKVVSGVRFEDGMFIYNYLILRFLIEEKRNVSEPKIP
jgi:hypothetical protein